MESLWPIIVLWIVFSVLGSWKKRQQRTLPPGPTPADATRQAEGGFVQEMQRALEEMKRAAAEQGQQRQKSSGQQDTAARYLEQRKKAASTRRGSQPVVFLPGEGRRKPVVRPQRPLEDDDAEKTSEDASVTSLEGSDYDIGAEQTAAVRAQASDRGARAAGTAEVMSESQMARRAQRTPVPLGTASEHSAWHKEIGAPAAAATATRRAGRLARWADGSLRGAVVLAEILGRPGGAR